MCACAAGGWTVDSAEKSAEVSADAWLYSRRRARAASRRAQSWRNRVELKKNPGCR
jgi:hypothetical protein